MGAFGMKQILGFFFVFTLSETRRLNAAVTSLENGRMSSVLTHGFKTLGIEKEIIVRKKKYNCNFKIDVSEVNVNLKKSSVNCKPRPVKKIKIKEVKLQKDGLTFIVTFIMHRSKFKLLRANVIDKPIKTTIEIISKTTATSRIPSTTTTTTTSTTKTSAATMSSSTKTTTIVKTSVTSWPATSNTITTTTTRVASTMKTTTRTQTTP